MAETTIGNLTLGAVDGTSLFEQERTDNGSQVSEKVTSSSVANFVGTSHQFAGLSTNAKNLVGAINEAASMGGVVQLTQAEYTALTTAEKMNGSIYKLTDKAVMMCLDEEYHAVKELLTAEYEALTSAQQNNGTIYIQTDAETTGSDIAVSSSDSTSIAAAITQITPITIDTTGAIASIYQSRGNKVGKLVILNLNLSLTSATSLRALLATVNVLPTNNIQFFLHSSRDNVMYECQLDTQGQVKWWNSTEVVAGAILGGQVMYFTN